MDLDQIRKWLTSSAFKITVTLGGRIIFCKDYNQGMIKFGECAHSNVLALSGMMAEDFVSKVPENDKYLFVALASDFNDDKESSNVVSEEVAAYVHDYHIMKGNFGVDLLE